MQYQVLLRRVVQKQLDELPGTDFEVIAGAITSLGKNPRPPKVKRLAGSDLWRIRVGRYRIVYAIDDTAGTVILVRVAKRTEVTYRGL